MVDSVEDAKLHAKDIIDSIFKDITIFERASRENIKECKGIEDIGQLLHILNNTYLKQRSYRNHKQKIAEMKWWLQKCPLLLSIPAEIQIEGIVKEELGDIMEDTVKNLQKEQFIQEIINSSLPLLQ